jgi:hypothetical protein
MLGWLAGAAIAPLGSGGSEHAFSGELSKRKVEQISFLLPDGFPPPTPAN